MDVNRQTDEPDPIAEAARAIVALTGRSGVRFHANEPWVQPSQPRYEDVYGLIARAAAAATASCTQGAPPSALKLRGTAAGLRYECSHAQKHCYDYQNGASTKC